MAGSLLRSLQRAGPPVNGRQLGAPSIDIEAGSKAGAGATGWGRSSGDRRPSAQSDTMIGRRRRIGRDACHRRLRAPATSDAEAPEANPSGAFDCRGTPGARARPATARSSFTHAESQADGGTKATPARGVGISNSVRLPDRACRKMRSTAQFRSAPQVARCSTHAQRRKTSRGINRRWMSVQRQVVAGDAIVAAALELKGQ